MKTYVAIGLITASVAAIVAGRRQISKVVANVYHLPFKKKEQQ